MDFVSSSLHMFSIISYNRWVAGRADPASAREGGGRPLQPGLFISTYKSGSRSPLFSWRPDLMQVAQTVALKPDRGQASASVRKK